MAILSQQEKERLRREVDQILQRRLIRTKARGYQASAQVTDESCLLLFVKATNLDDTSTTTKAILNVQMGASGGTSIALLGGLAGAGNQSDQITFRGVYCASGFYLNSAGTTATNFGFTVEWVEIRDVAEFLSEDPLDLENALSDAPAKTLSDALGGGGGRGVTTAERRGGVGP